MRRWLYSNCQQSITQRASSMLKNNSWFKSLSRRLLLDLKRVLKRLDLRGHLHTFRHSFISFAAIRGGSERVLQKWVGHLDREIWIGTSVSQTTSRRRRCTGLMAVEGLETTRTSEVFRSAQFQQMARRRENDKSAK